jgi:hypothetical protein
MSARSVRSKSYRLPATGVVAEAHSYRNVSVNGTQDVVRDYQPCGLLRAPERRVARRNGTPVLLKSVRGADPGPLKVRWNRSACIESERRFKLG